MVFQFRVRSMTATVRAEQHRSFPQQPMAAPAGDPQVPAGVRGIESLQSFLGLPRGLLPAGHACGGTGVSSVSKSSTWLRCGGNPLQPPGVDACYHHAEIYGA